MPHDLIHSYMFSFHTETAALEMTKRQRFRITRPLKRSLERFLDIIADSSHLPTVSRQPGTCGTPNRD
ncbi:hypothetical protein GDO81_013527 [Engystomops pustulosus]|uniref:Uncharacterized protein n=1 Tax=Engystomops pustulosus TaxID=76066 RepID=A0AAV7B069_ENGPU|nr:hypothetical protein GDO81_013527 [Engystomops pustulosus]